MSSRLTSWRGAVIGADRTIWWSTAAAVIGGLSPGTSKKRRRSLARQQSGLLHQNGDYSRADLRKLAEDRYDMDWFCYLALLAGGVGEPGG